MNLQIIPIDDDATLREVVGELERALQHRGVRRYAMAIYGAEAESITFETARDTDADGEQYFVVTSMGAVDARGREVGFDLGGSFWTRILASVDLDGERPPANFNEIEGHAASDDITAALDEWRWSQSCFRTSENLSGTWDVTTDVAIEYVVFRKPDSPTPATDVACDDRRRATPGDIAR